MHEYFVHAGIVKRINLPNEEQAFKIKKILSLYKKTLKGFEETDGWRFDYRLIESKRSKKNRKPVILIDKVGYDNVLKMFLEISAKKKHFFIECGEMNGEKLKFKISRKNHSIFLNNPFCCVCGLNLDCFYSSYYVDKTLKHNVYLINPYGHKDGVPVLFTKDHIVPESLGGQEVDENIQVMCENCNVFKGNSQIDNESLKYLIEVNDILIGRKTISLNLKQTLISNLKSFLSGLD